MTQESPSNSTPRMTGWILIGLLLCIAIYFDATARYTVHLLFSLFLPLVTAVVAHRYGARVFSVLTILAIPAMLGVGWHVTEVFTVYYDISSLVFLLSIGTAIAFCRPAIGVSAADILNARFSWTRWLILIALSFMLSGYASFERDFSTDFYFETNIGAIAIVALLALSVRWNKVTATFSQFVLTSKRRWINILRAAIWILLITAIVLKISWDFDYVFMFEYGFADATSILFVAVLTVTALGILDWRIAVVAAAIIGASEGLAEPLYEWIESSLAEAISPLENGDGTTDDLGLGDIVVTGSTIRGSGFTLGYFNSFVTTTVLCLGLLGAAVAPAWARRNPEELETRRTATYIISAVCVAYASMPLGLMWFDFAQYLTLIVAALLMGYRWRYRALILAPLLLVFSFLAVGFALAPSFYNIPPALNAVDIFFVTFPATFIGVLFNRYRPATDDITTADQALGR